MNNELKEMLKYPKRQLEFMQLLYSQIVDLPRESQIEIVNDFKERIINL